MKVYIEACRDYNIHAIDSVLMKWQAVFDDIIHKGDTVVIKPNWLAESNKYNEDEWESVITHPNVITAVLKTVLGCLDNEGKIIITDAPQTNSCWDEIMRRMDPELWIRMGRKEGIDVQIIDLRDHEWTTKGDVIIHRKELRGNPLGSTECNLGDDSEFANHKVSQRGYYGADYNKEETNQAHSHGNHRYKVSRAVLEAGVFINLPKMKTHKKAGITCSLKNLVGINTYKNWLPHYNEGTPDEGGDQFPQSTLKTKAEVVLLDKFMSYLSSHPRLGRWFIPIKKFGKVVFGDTRNTIRSGGWYGNDTVWRMVIDLNKILFYSNPDGSLRQDDLKERKKYLSIVDAIVSGEGNGPEAPDPKHTGLLIMGTNPASVDAVCARLMGFDWRKIPSIRHAFAVDHYPICNFTCDDVVVISSDRRFSKKLLDFSQSDTFHFTPHFGWVDHIEWQEVIP